MNNLVDQAPKIIAESAKSPLGIVSLMILALSTIGYLFFSSSSEIVKISMFILMFTGYGSFAFSLFKRRPVIPTTLNQETGAKENDDQYFTQIAPDQISEGAPDRISVSLSQKRLGLVWCASCVTLLALLTAQTIFDKYDNGIRVWVWIAPIMLPPVSTLVAGMAYDALRPTANITASRFAYRVSLGISVLFLISILITILIEPFLSVTIELASLVLAPLEGMVVIAMTVYLMSKNISRK